LNTRGEPTPLPMGAAGGEGPLVSIILPVYNGERFVGQTIESALQQTYRNIEIIAIDDGSTDRTLTVIESLAAGDSRIRVIHQPNAGVARARNRGLEESHGEFVAPLDADDLWDPRKIEQQVRRMQEVGDNAGLVYCWWVWIDEQGKVLDRSPRWDVEGHAQETLLQINFTGNASVPLYRRRCLEEVGGYDESLEQQGARGCEDWDVALKVSAQCGVAVVPQLLVGYRRLPESMSTQCQVMWRSQQLLTSGLQQRQPELEQGLLKRSDAQFNLYIASVLFRSGDYIRSFGWAIRAWRTGLLFRVLPYVIRFLMLRVLPGRGAGQEIMRPGTSLQARNIPDALIPYDRIYGAGTGGKSLAAQAAGWRGSWILQSIVLILAFLFVAAVHRNNDGLWFQGDAPRHAANGLFWYDLIAARPASFTDFAVRYYARYPIINPVAYPPLFYIVEGLAFRGFGPSPYVAKYLILALSIMAGFYTMAWARRWLGQGAGWAGAFLAFVPGFVIWTNTVMLNIPATALGLACLYHWRRWYDSSKRRDVILAACFAAAAVLTYYQAGIAIAICLAWTPMLRAAGETGKQTRYAVTATALFATGPVVLAAAVAPIFVTRNLPGLRALLNLQTWTFYPASLPALLGPALALGLIGVAAGFGSAVWRKEAKLVAAWIATPVAVFSFLPAKDPRYVLLIVPAFVLGAAIGIAFLLRQFPAISPRWQAAALLAGLAAAGWHTSEFRLPQKQGFRAVVLYLREHAANDAVLYDGYHDGLFGFYLRAFDPQFRRRLVLGQQFLYHYGPAADFNWVETMEATSTKEVVNILRTRSGCSWVAIEVGPYSDWAQGQRLLRAAVAGPEFELDHSFPIDAPNAKRVDLYRLVGGALPVSAFDLQLASFSNRIFQGVVPIAREP
jgi:glycosyltransferase involved in cell wall biosynthesis